MADEQWLSFQELVELVPSLLPDVSIGRAEAIVKEALASGQVRSRPGRLLLLSNDGIIGMDLRPGAINKGGEGRGLAVADSKTSKEDFLDWLGRHYPEAKVQTQGKIADLVSLALKSADDSVIHQEITAVYDEADKNGVWAPNINELPKQVMPRLVARGYNTSERRIKEIGEAPEFKTRRRKIGMRRT